MNLYHALHRTLHILIQAQGAAAPLRPARNTGPGEVGPGATLALLGLQKKCQIELVLAGVEMPYHWCLEGCLPDRRKMTICNLCWEVPR